MGAVDFEPWVVHYDKVAVRKEPSTTAPILFMLERGDVFNVSETFTDQGNEWVRVPKGTSLVASKDACEMEQELQKQDGFIQLQHPALGTLVRRKPGVAVQEVKEEGMLSKEEMQSILRKSSNAKDLIIPLEAKTWSRSEFELFVMSGGTVRPKWCSIPDTNEMINTNMKPHEVERALAVAAEWIAGADAVLVGSGAGMGVDSGLSTFRGGKAGVWPALEVIGLAYEEICDPKWFVKEPELAWGFWNFCHEAYRNTKPHRGYEIVRNWACKAPLGAFSFTSNIDSHWGASGWPKKRIIEVHGAVAWHQCSQACCADVWEAPADLGLRECPSTHRVEGKLPLCPKCGAVARPCVQMFGGDSRFAKSRRAVQINRYDGWLKKLEARPDAQEIRLVCLELGCGLTVPTVRRELESVLRRFKNAKLIRINPEHPGLAKELVDVGLSLPLPAGTALAKLEPQVHAALAQQQEMLHYVLWDEQGGGVELTAPASTPCIRLLRLAEAESGAEVELGKEYPKFEVVQLVQLNLTQELHPAEPVPASFLWNLNKRRKGARSPTSVQASAQDATPEAAEAKDLSEDEPEGRQFHTAVIKCHRVTFKHGMTPQLASRVAEIGKMLDAMNEKFGEEAYQNAVRKKVDRRGVLQLVREVHLEVLPKFGLQPDESGVYQMQALTGLGMVGRQDISAKAALSMHLSYMNEAMKLPQVVRQDKAGVKEETPKTSGTPAPVPSSQPAPVSAPSPPAVPPPAEPLQVTLTQFGVDQPAQLKLDVTSDMPLSALRDQLGKLLGLDAASLRQVKFLSRMANSFITMKDTELVKKEMMVTNLHKWVPVDAGAGPAAATPAPPAAAAQAGHSAVAREAAPRRRPPEPPKLTVEAALALQRDLIQGFGDPEFQRQLKELQRSLQPVNERKFNFERSRLFLTVQSKVLPKYGFSGDQKGVFEMMGVLTTGGFERSEDFARNGLLLDKLLFSPLEEPPVPSTPASPSASSSAPRTPGAQQKMDWKSNLVAWMLTSVSNRVLQVLLQETLEGMSGEDAEAWERLPEELRQAVLGKIISSPFFARCCRDPSFAARVWVLPGQRAAWSHVEDDPALREVAAENPRLLTRWFAYPASATSSGASSLGTATPTPATTTAPEPLVVSVIRLGDDPPVRWNVTMTKNSRVSELRQGIAVALGLSDQATQRLRFATKRGNSFVSVEDNEPVRQAMAVRGLEVWPPPEA